MSSAESLNAAGEFLTYPSTTSSPTPDSARRTTSAAEGESLTVAVELPGFAFCATPASTENAVATAATQPNSRVLFIKSFLRSLLDQLIYTALWKVNVKQSIGQFKNPRNRRRRRKESHLFRKQEVRVS